MCFTFGKYYNLRFFYLHSECFGNCHHFLASVSQFRRGLSSCCTDVSYVVVTSKHQGFRHQPAFRLELCGSCTDTSVTTALFFALVIFASDLFIKLFYCFLSLKANFNQLLSISVLSSNTIRSLASKSAWFVTTI